MEPREPMKALRLILAWSLAGIFGFAGAVKLSDPAAFARDIENYRLLEPPFTGMLAAYLPWLEILSAIALLVPRLREGALRIIFALSLAFLTALLSAKLRSIDVNCGCFGGGPSHNITLALARTTGLAVAALLSIWLEFRKRQTCDRPPGAV